MEFLKVRIAGSPNGGSIQELIDNCPNNERFVSTLVDLLSLGKRKV